EGFEAAPSTRPSRIRPSLSRSARPMRLGPHIAVQRRVWRRQHMANRAVAALTVEGDFTSAPCIPRVRDVHRALSHHPGGIWRAPPSSNLKVASYLPRLASSP